MPNCPACDRAASEPGYLGRGRFRSFSYEYRSCRGCGSLYLDPMPGPALLDEIYAPGYVGQHYAVELEGQSKSRELGRELDETARLIARLHPGGRVLDVGCGAGRFLTTARGLGLLAEGQERVAATAERVASATRTTVHGMTLEEMAQKGLRYDVVHFADVLEHSPKPIDLLGAAAGLLGPGGKIVVRGPLQNQPTLFREVVRFQRFVRTAVNGRPLPPREAPPYHVVLFTRAGWHELIERGGLKVAEERVYEVQWPAPEGWSVRPVALVKRLSRLATDSPIGRRFELGDRVVSVLERS